MYVRSNGGLNKEEKRKEGKKAVEKEHEIHHRMRTLCMCVCEWSV